MQRCQAAADGAVETGVNVVGGKTVRPIVDFIDDGEDRSVAAASLQGASSSLRCSCATQASRWSARWTAPGLDGDASEADQDIEAGNVFATLDIVEIGTGQCGTLRCLFLIEASGPPGRA